MKKEIVNDKIHTQYKVIVEKGRGLHRERIDLFVLGTI